MQVLARNKTKITGSRATVSDEAVSFSKLLREREADLPNPTTTAENQLEARTRRPRGAGRPGYAEERPKRRLRRDRRGRAAQPASTKKPRAALAWKAPGAHL